MELEAAAVDEAAHSAPPVDDLELLPFDCGRRCSRGGESLLYLSPSQEGYRGFVPVRFRNESTLPGARHSHFRA